MGEIRQQKYHHLTKVFFPTLLVGVGGEKREMGRIMAAKNWTETNLWPWILRDPFWIRFFRIISEESCELTNTLLKINSEFTPEF